MSTLTSTERYELIQSWLHFFARLKLNPEVFSGALIRLPHYHVQTAQGLTVIPVAEVSDNNFFEQYLHADFLHLTPFVVVDGEPAAKAYPLFTNNGTGGLGSVLAIFAFSSSVQEKKMFTNPNKIDLITRKIDQNTLLRHGSVLQDALDYTQGKVAEYPTKSDPKGKEDGKEETTEKQLLAEMMYNRIVWMSQNSAQPFSQNELVWLQKRLQSR